MAKTDNDDVLVRWVKAKDLRSGKTVNVKMSFLESNELGTADGGMVKVKDLDFNIGSSDSVSGEREFCAG